MNLFRKANGKLFVKNDLNIVIDFLKAAIKSELNSARIKKTKGIAIDLGDDRILRETRALVESVIRNIDTIRKRAEHAAKDLLGAKGPGGALSADEKYAVDMCSIQDIKREGLIRVLSRDERKIIKDGAKRFHAVYSEQIKNFKTKEKYNR
ncbi:MAG: hypothetical protein LBJ73_01145 [Rickettsiales bacterium]|jgi:hypothetical protein|nr:hypothetical protein [Rickettsiales bacterium]